MHRPRWARPPLPAQHSPGDEAIAGLILTHALVTRGPGSRPRRRTPRWARRPAAAQAGPALVRPSRRLPSDYDQTCRFPVTRPVIALASGFARQEQAGVYLLSPRSRGPFSVVLGGPADGVEYGDGVEVVAPVCDLAIPDRDDGDKVVVVGVSGTDRSSVDGVFEDDD